MANTLNTVISGNKSILFVCKRSEQTDQFSSTLVKGGFDITMKQTAKEALESIAEVQPILLISSINLPDLSGFDLCRKIKSNDTNNSIPVILINIENESDKLAAIEAGASDIIDASVSPEAFLAKVSSLVASNHVLCEAGMQDFQFKNIFSKVFLISPGCVSISRINDGMFAFINRGFTNTLGYTESDILGKTAIEKDIWYNLSDRNRWIDEITKNEVVIDFETQLRTKEGNIIYVLISASLIEFDGQKQVLCITRDVTGKIQSEKMLMEKELLFKESQQVASIGSYRLNLDSMHWTTSEELDKIFEIDTHYDKSVQGWLNLIFEKDREMMSDYFLNEVVAKKARFNKEYRIQQYLSKEVKWVHGLGKLFFDDEGNIVSMVGTIQDITKRRLIEQEGENFLKFFEISSDVMLIVDLSGNLKKVNPATAQLLGYDVDSIILQPSLSFVHPDDKQTTQDNFFRQKETGQTVNFEIRCICKDGTVKWLSWLVDINETDNVIYVTGRDITEKKQNQEILAESERRFRELLSTVKMISLIIDVDGNVTFCNDYFYKLTNWESQEVIGLNWFDHFLPKDTIDYVREIIFDAVTNGTVLSNIENKISDRSGNELLISWTNTLLYDSNGTVNGIASLGVDITEHRKAEISLRRAKDRLNRAELAAKTGNWELDINTLKVKVSRGAAMLYGLSKKNLDYKEIKEIPLEEYRPKLDVALKNLIGKNEPYDVEFKVRATDTGEIKDIHSTASFDKEKEILFGVIQDVTAKKKMDEALLQSEETYRLMFENNPQPMLIYDFDTLDILEVNKQAILHYGYSRDEFLSLTVIDISPSEDIPNVDEYIQKLRLGGVPEHNVWRHVKKNQEIAFVEFTSVTVNWNGHSARHVLINDVTEKEFAQRKLQEKMDELIRFHNLTVDRELTMIELKKEVNDLLEKGGHKPKYKIVN